MNQEPPTANHDQRVSTVSAPDAGDGQPVEDMVGFSLRWAKRIVVAAIGGTVMFIGVAMVVLPGPAFVVIPLGLAILATEFVWARRWLRKLKSMIPGNKVDGAIADPPGAGSQPTEQTKPEPREPTSP